MKENKKILIDTHTHSIASGHHTTNTIVDLAKKASQIGLEYLAITDHSFGLPNGAKEAYFLNLCYADKQKFGVKLLYGVEANIMDTSGNLDLSQSILSKLDFTIASLHKDVLKPMSESLNTKALLCAMDNKYVNIIGHPDNIQFPINYEMLVEKAKDVGVILELNSASIMPNSYRGNSIENTKKILNLCKKYGTYISLGSDSHGTENIGDFALSLQLLTELNFPLKLVVNYDMNLFFKLISSRKG